MLIGDGELLDECKKQTEQAHTQSCEAKEQTEEARKQTIEAQKANMWTTRAFWLSTFAKTV